MTNNNTGCDNTGYYNTGNYNTGYYNTGHNNTGCDNTGYNNTGNWNTGNYNTGNWNTTKRETGYFNTVTPQTVNVFNKPCAIDLWDEACKPSFLYFNLTEWVAETDMTDEEKENSPTYKTTGGYLKSYDYKEAFQESYAKATNEDKELLLKLPNFDAEVFKEISGIDVTEKAQTCNGKVVEIDGKKYKLQEVK